MSRSRVVVSGTILVLCLFFILPPIAAVSFDYPTANLSTSWTNSLNAPHSIPFSDGSTIRAVLLRSPIFGPNFACGFFCNGDCTGYLFAIYIVQTNSGGGITQSSIGFPQVVWSANRDNPVGLNATLVLTSDGDLVLRGSNGRVVWSTGTAGKSVSGLKLTDSGNLVLFNHKNATVWQSFDHPTDCLVPGQRLFSGQKLTASISSTNWTQGLSSLLVTDEGLFAQVESIPPQVYYENRFGDLTSTRATSKYITLLNGSLALNGVDVLIHVPYASSAQYIKLGPDGHLRVIEWEGQWRTVADLLTDYTGECHYPLACGRNAICSDQHQCSCPSSEGSDKASYFRPVKARQPNLGCNEIVPLNCNAKRYHTFLELDNIYYFDNNFSLQNVDAKRCKKACLGSCSCKAAILQYPINSTVGYCHLLSEVFTMMDNNTNNMHYNSIAFLKVQRVRRRLQAQLQGVIP